MSRFIISFEELEKEFKNSTTAVTDQEPGDSLELTVDYELQENTEDSAELNNIIESSEELTQAHNDVDSLIVISNNLEKIEKPSEEIIAIANEAISNLYVRLGIKSETKLSLESFNESNNKKVFLNVAVESIFEKVKMAIKAVINFFKEIWNRVVEFFKTIFDKTERLKKKTKAFKTEMYKLKATPKKDKLTGSDLHPFRDTLAVGDGPFVVSSLSANIDGLTKTVKEYSKFTEDLSRSIQNIQGLETVITDKNLYDKIEEKTIFRTTEGWINQGINGNDFFFDFKDLREREMFSFLNVFIYNSKFIGRKAIVGKLPTLFGKLNNKLVFNSWKKAKIGLYPLAYKETISNVIDIDTFTIKNLNDVLDSNLKLLNQVSDSKKLMSDLDKLNKDTVKHLEDLYKYYDLKDRKDNKKYSYDNNSSRAKDVLSFVRNIPNITSYAVIGLLKHSLDTATHVLQFVKLNAKNYEYESITDSKEKAFSTKTGNIPLLA